MGDNNKSDFLIDDLDDNYIEELNNVDKKNIPKEEIPKNDNKSEFLNENNKEIPKNNKN